MDNFYNDSANTNTKIEEFEDLMLDSVREFMNLPDHFSNTNGGLCTFQPTVGNSSLMAVNLAKKNVLHKELLKNPLLKKKDIISRLVGYFPSTSHSHCIKSLSLLDIKYNRSIKSIYSPITNSYNIDLNQLEN
jgi:glutamate/tyrosine decarboxylase-like PLP-dependent enzyme